MKVRELLSDESKWMKFTLARKSDGTATYPKDPDAISFCLYGAIERCYPAYDDAIDIVIKVAKAFGEPFIGAWNDVPERTFKEVKALVERLDI